jgi:recombinational DNA repair ATPase RecF
VIRAKKLRVQEFRGIRDLTLDFGGKNFAICGPNGTGKSGIVDAVEFVLTGNISRLTGAGTGGLSVKEHGPHVDSRNKPDTAVVTLTVDIPSLGQEATLTRSAQDAKKLKISPDKPEIRAALDNVALHPEFTLSRRQLIKYVLSEPGKRAKDVQELLRLDEVESVRGLLQKITNASERDVIALRSAADHAASALRSALILTKISPADILTVANETRDVLSLPALSVLEANTSIKDGIVSASTPHGSPTVSKTHAKDELTEFRDSMSALTHPEFSSRVTLAKADMAELVKNELFLKAASRESLLQSALALYDEQICPVCDTPWKPEDFRKHLAHKLEHFAAVAQKRTAVQATIAPIDASLERVQTAASTVARQGATLRPPVNVKEITQFSGDLGKWRDQLHRLLPINATVEALGAIATVPPGVLTTLEQLTNAVSALPEPSQQDAAKEFLIIGQEKLEAYRKARLALSAAERKAKTARFVFDHYAKSTTEALEGIYSKVQDFFSHLYRLINREDEKAFQARLRPSIGKLGFDVDFYGRGFFPPGAYHSEGHQDGMGLCLYLALMNHLAGPSFTFAVLDDVLMSVDSGHRREVSRMLREQFPNTQFVLTTHDEIWLRHMKTVGLIEAKKFVHFRTWDVSVGPTQWDEAEVWDKIGLELKKSDVRAAAGLLRNFLEHFAKEACQELRAQVDYKGDAQYTLNDLLPNAVARLNKYLRQAKTSAVSWGDDTLVQAVTAREAEFDKRAKAVLGDQWQMNAVIHYNEWENLTPNDFKPVVASFRDLTAFFKCDQCHDLHHPLPAIGDAQSLRCYCGKTNLNLIKKP